MSNTPRRKGSTTTKGSRTKSRQPVQPESTRDWKKIGGWAVGILVAVGLIAFIILDQPEQVDLPNDAEIPDGVEFFNVEDRSHVAGPVAYPQDPPVGGPHAERWLNCGFYDEAIPNENAVHSMEHGIVWITYQPDLDDLGSLRALGNEPEVIVSPYPGLGSPVVASTWGAQMSFDSADDPQILDFVVALRNVTAPEAGAGCLQGLGQPVS